MQAYISLYKSQFMTLAGEKKSLQQKNPFVRLRRDYWLADFLCPTVSFTWFLPLVVYLEENILLLEINLNEPN